VAPFVVLKDVQAIAASLQNGVCANKSNRVDMDAKRSSAEKEKQREAELLREYEIESNTPEDWMKIDQHKQSIIQNKTDIISDLQAQINSLKRDLETEDEECKTLYDLYQKHRRKVHRVSSTLTEFEVADRLNNTEQQVLNRVQNMIAQDGGVSRLTLFNDKWHKQHDNAAKQLWGYHSWEETKLYVGAYFPELDTSYDPSAHLKVSEGGTTFALPNLTAFEECLIVRMFFHTFSHQQVVALFINRARTRVGHLLEEWVPRWANVGMDLSSLT
jgi:hypothetical protein